MTRVRSLVLALVTLVSCACNATASSADQSTSNPSVDVFKQVLEKSLLSLLPEGMSERQVLFQRVTAGTGRAFRATVLIRDYGAGYPKNRYYGSTCVGTFTDETYTLAPDQFGGWTVAGRLTAPEKKCTDNPAEGVSSMPLAGLTGASAPKESGAAPRPAAVPASTLAQGEYLCWANGQARLLMNFTVTGAGRYTGFENKPGTFVFDATTERVTFTGGPLQNVMPEGFYARYYMPNGTHTVSFVSARGAEAAFCEKR